MFDIQEELKKLPDCPGVYIMHDEADAIIYVGKAVSLRNRVRQYFQTSRNKGPKIEHMVTHIRRFEYIVADSETEALVLECNLIKEHRPKYNTMLMDDKTYPYIKVTLGENFPRVLFSRLIKKDKSRYFGPYTKGSVKDIIELINKIYRLRTCNRVLPRDCGKERPCLNYHINRCTGPCTGNVTEEEYRERVKGALDFLNGNYKSAIELLEGKMKEASDNLDFEAAMEYRDQIKNVQTLAMKQKITDFDGEDRDVIAMSRDRNDAVMAVFFVRGGRLIGREHFNMSIGNEDENGELFLSFIQQYYSGTPYIPREILIPMEIPESDIISNWLSKRTGHKVTIRVPKKGTKEKLLEMAAENARIVLINDKERIKREEGRTLGAVKEIAELLGMERIHRMEAFDISNISGFNSVGSMVVYEKGKPYRSDYRKFRLKTVTGPDDYASMHEVLTRRFSHGLQEIEEAQGSDMVAETSSFSKFPDLIMMDGGKGQVNIALQVLEELGLNIPVCGMVKDDNHRTRGLYFNNEEIPIDTHSEGFKLITRIQDEAHRFAIEYHRSLRSKGQVHSILDDIPNIGKERRKALLKTFASLDEIKAATVEELKNIPGMNEKAAVSVYEFFHS